MEIYITNDITLIGGSTVYAGLLKVIGPNVRLTLTKFPF